MAHLVGWWGKFVVVGLVVLVGWLGSLAGLVDLVELMCWVGSVGWLVCVGVACLDGPV